MTTHKSTESVDACRLFGWMLHKALARTIKDEILFENEDLVGDNAPLCSKIKAIADGEYLDKTESEIKGSGYVVESLEAALWCFHKTENFRDAILRAVNLGDDADTTGAICGQIAGAFYGEDGIPEEWLERLVMREKISEMAESLYQYG